MQMAMQLGGGRRFSGSSIGLPISPSSSPSVPTEGWKCGFVTFVMPSCAIIDNDIFMHHSSYIGPFESSRWCQSLHAGDVLEFIAIPRQEGAGHLFKEESSCISNGSFFSVRRQKQLEGHACSRSPGSASKNVL